MKETTRTPYVKHKREMAMFTLGYALSVIMTIVLAALCMFSVISVATFLTLAVSMLVIYSLAIVTNMVYNAVRTLIDTN